MASVGRNGTILTVCARAETTPFFIAIVCIFMNLHVTRTPPLMCGLCGVFHLPKMQDTPFLPRFTGLCQDLSCGLLCELSKSFRYRLSREFNIFRARRGGRGIRRGPEKKSKYVASFPHMHLYEYVLMPSLTEA